MVGHVRKGVGGGAGEGHGIPGQIAAGVSGGDGDLMAALAQAGEGGGEGAGGGVPLKGTGCPSTFKVIRSAAKPPWRLSVILAVAEVPETERETVGAVVSQVFSLDRTT